MPSRSAVRWLWVVFAAGVALVAAVLLIASTVPFTSDVLRQRVIATLSDRFEGEVELAGLELRVFPRFHVKASGLSIRHHGRRDVPPLINVDSLTVDASFVSLARKHISTVSLSGLQITIPREQGDADDDGPRNSRSPSMQARNADARQVVVDQLTSTDARIVILPSQKEKPPKVWQIHQLAMQSVSFDRPMPFDATLRNAIPTGEIHTKGSFGPWQSTKPGATSLEGTFTFDDADLSVFKGISGMLSAHGEFGGSLGRLGVHGETDTPQFTVSVSGQPVPLHADYHTTVDGTNGDTLLDYIDASFLNTSLVAKGSVVATPEQRGRTVTLDIVMDKARVEDVLRLAIKAPKSPLTGAMKLRTTFVLPPGDRDVVERLELDGQFEIATAKFTNVDIQKKIDELSRRSRRSTPEIEQSSVVSNFAGRFLLARGTLALPRLTFNTTGARVQLLGRYTLRPQILDFKGMLLMDATISETQKGWKRLALKPFDAVFAQKGGGGTAIPIKIEGKRSAPAFGLDRRALLSHDK